MGDFMPLSCKPLPKLRSPLPTESLTLYSASLFGESDNVRVLANSRAGNGKQCHLSPARHSPGVGAFLSRRVFSGAPCIARVCVRNLGRAYSLLVC
jgi:hypothetical protein